MIKNECKINIGSTWTNSKSAEFTVSKIEVRENKVWVFYKNKKNNIEFSCLEEAFVSRFVEYVNYKYEN